VSRVLLNWRAAQPVDPVVADDFAKVSRLLRTFAPLRGTQPDLSRDDRRHLGQAIVGAMAMTADIGTWNQTTVTRMGRGRQIYVPAATLTGDQVTDVLALTEAKLTGRYAPADLHLVDSAGALYTRTAPQRDPALLGAGGLTLRAQPLRLDTRAPGHDPIERST
jgi:hypothetical protein